MLRRELHRFIVIPNLAIKAKIRYLFDQPFSKKFYNERTDNVGILTNSSGN